MSDHGLRVLLSAIQSLHPGANVTADSVRHEFDIAQLNTSDRGAAFKSAATLGYLEGTDRVIRSTITSRKNGANRLWIRTSKAIPDHVCKISEAVTDALV